MKKTTLKTKKLNELEEVKRYYTINNFNQTKVIEEIKTLLKNNGAIILTNQYEKIVNIEVQKKYDDKTNKELENNINYKSFKAVKHDLLGDTLYFILDNYYYYISFDDNPLFPIHYQKIKIDNNYSYKNSRYLYSTDEINDKSWKQRKEIAISIAYDDLFKIIDSKTIKEIAQDFYTKMVKYIINGSESAAVSEKRRVYNYYNSNYHYEYITDNKTINILKDRFIKDKDAFYQVL